MSRLKTRTRYTIGRPRVEGLRLPELAQVLQDPQTRWQQLRLPWYGQGERPLELCPGTALWYRSGYDPLPIRWVLTRDPLGQRHPKAICSTDPTQTADQIVNDEISRWSLEVTFEEGRPLVIARKISGGTRSSKGSQTRMALFSLFGSWAAQGLNPFFRCLAALARPNPLS